MLMIPTDTPGTTLAQAATAKSGVSDAIARLRAERDRERARANENEALAEILQSVVRASRELVEEPDFETGVNRWLATLGGHTDAARASFYDTLGTQGGPDQQLRVLADWSAVGVRNSMPVSFRDAVVVPVDAEAAWWQAALANRPYAAHVEDLPTEARAFLEAQGTATVLIVPFRAKSRTWAVSFDFLVHREFDGRVLAILQTAAGSIASEIERRDAEASKLAAETERADLLSSVQRASSLLLSASRLADVAEQAIGIVGQALSCDLVAIGEFAPPSKGSALGWIDWRHFWPIHPGAGADAERPAAIRFNIDDQREAHACYSEGRLHLVGDLDRWTEPAAAVIKDMGARSCFGVPISVEGKLWGKLSGACNHPRDWNAAEIETLSMIAAAIGATIERERLTAQRIEAERALSQERARIAREIHDTLAQGFTGIILQGEAARARASLGPETAFEHLRRATDLAKFGLSEARRSVLALRPLVLEQKGLGEALAELAERVSVPGYLAVSYRQAGPGGRPSPQVEDVLFRAAQEALTNAMRHSGSPGVAIRLAFRQSGVTLHVIDRGSGFDAAAVREGSTGTGLRALADRIARLGGRLDVVSTPGRGTTIRAGLPLSNRGLPR